MDNRTSIKKTTQGVSDTKVQSTNKSMNVLEQFPNATGMKKNADGSTTIELAQPQNRAQRRAMAKRNKKIQKRQNKMIMDYIKRHPEAVKVELDEDKIAEIEEQQQEEVFVTGMTVVEENEENPIIDENFVTTVEHTEEEKDSTTSKFTPVIKNNITKE